MYIITSIQLINCVRVCLNVLSEWHDRSDIEVTAYGNILNMQDILSFDQPDIEVIVYGNILKTQGILSFDQLDIEVIVLWPARYRSLYHYGNILKTQDILSFVLYKSSIMFITKGYM